MSKAKRTVASVTTPTPPADDLPPDDALTALMGDDSAFEKATAKEGKVVGYVVAAGGRGVPKTVAAAAQGMSAREATAAGFTRIGIVFNGYVNSRPEWELLDEVRHVDPVLGCTLIAPKGYKFDLASVPRPLWSVIAPFDLSTLAPLFHDLVYEFKGRMPAPAYINPYPFRRFVQKDADDLFLRLMAAEGVSGWKRNAAYVAVRSFGWTYWNT